MTAWRVCTHCGHAWAQSYIDACARCGTTHPAARPPRAGLALEQR